jgi:hypothetical protein
MEGLADGLQGFEEARFAEPAAEDGGRGPVLRRRAGFVFVEGAEKRRLLVTGVWDSRHKRFLERLLALKTQEGEDWERGSKAGP